MKVMIYIEEFHISKLSKANLLRQDCVREV